MRFLVTVKTLMNVNMEKKAILSVVVRFSHHPDRSRILPTTRWLKHTATSPSLSRTSIEKINVN